MVSKAYLAVILGMGLVTFLPRWLPLIYLTKRSLPSWLVEWLDFIPAAILSAILLPALVTDSATRSFDLGRAESIVAIPTFLFAIATKSLGGTVIVGMVLFGLAEKFLNI
jgi:branched-subunit amino acid transport protein